ncbi:hypothetical protein KJ605_02575 [Patescibacteria group bacterium]|nr:hypothetical protein [Patescibacteria group bacterium]
MMDKLSSEDGSTWLEAFKRFLRKENPWTKPLKIFAIVELGTFEDVQALLLALKTARMHVNEPAYNMLNRMALVEERCKVRLVAPSIEELGFTESAAYEDILSVAESKGLSLCPAEVGPQLLLQYKYKPPVELLVIAMEPVGDLGGQLLMFSPDPRLKGLYAYYVNNRRGLPWNISHRLVFVQEERILS